jgi:hypothetical protein
MTPDGFIHFVIDSVFAMAYAIQAIINKSCANHTVANLFDCEGFSTKMGPRLLKEIRTVEFDSITGRRVKFLKNGDGIIPFEVFQYQKMNGGKYGYEKIAEWDSEKK